MFSTSLIMFISIKSLSIFVIVLSKSLSTILSSHHHVSVFIDHFPYGHICLFSFACQDFLVNAWFCEIYIVEG